MAYKITGLEPSQFSYLIGLSDDHLARHNAARVKADKDRGFPCRVSLEDARAGETLILVHHTRQYSLSVMISSVLQTFTLKALTNTAAGSTHHCPLLLQ